MTISRAAEAVESGSRECTLAAEVPQKRTLQSSLPSEGIGRGKDPKGTRVSGGGKGKLWRSGRRASTRRRSIKGGWS